MTRRRHSRTSIRLLAAAGSVLLIWGVHSRPLGAAPGAVLVAHADAPGIDWFQGDVTSAFEAARKSNRPVFLYWGATWCPPCQQLKSAVFSRSDFIDKSKQFVAVYLDGDDRGAQKWGDTFHVAGYPTVVILRPDQKEIMRLSGGLDLSMYADVLDIAINDATPIAAVIRAMHAPDAALSRADCRRLVYNGWDSNDIPADQSETLARDLMRASGACAELTAVERAQLAVVAASLAPIRAAVDEVIADVQKPSLAPSLVGMLELLGEPFFTAVQSRGEAVSSPFEAAWVRTLDGAAHDAARIDADRLAATYAKLDLVKQFSHGSIPPDMADAARADVAVALAKTHDPYVRTGVVNVASGIDEKLGDDDAQYSLLMTELATSKTPYYYMADLGELAADRGDIPAALAWYERAYDESRGIATRFQWGARYLGALLRLTPTDHGRIRSVGTAVLGELDGPERIQARTRAGLERLDKKLRQWNANHEYSADIVALRARMRSVCRKLPSSDPSLASCREFLS